MGIVHEVAESNTIEHTLHAHTHVILSMALQPECSLSGT